MFFQSAIDFIEQEKKEPFFVYLSTYLPHDPHTIPDEQWVEKYKGKTSKYVGHFFAGIERIDQNLASLRKALELSGKADNTIFIFMTDNGGTGGVKLFNAGMRGAKGSPYEGGHRVPFFIHWPNGKLQHGKNVKALTSHIDVLPTLLALTNVKPSKTIDFDGVNLASLLKSKSNITDEQLANRTLFVEHQRTFEAKPWFQTAGMLDKWRLINDVELYDIATDPGQQNNVIDQYPEVVNSIRAAHQNYWQRVTPNDRQPPLVILGHETDPETFLSPSDWHLPDVPWNHAQVAAGKKNIGKWFVRANSAGKYRFEVRRWPREADATITGIPAMHKKLDAWNSNGPVNKLIYGNTLKALPVKEIILTVAGKSKTLPVNGKDKAVHFEFYLPASATSIAGKMLNQQGEIIAGAYYVYVTKIE